MFADTLGRTLTYAGYRLTHVINITDVGHLTDDADAGEDKVEMMAAKKLQSIWDIARHYRDAYWNDIRALNIRQPTNWPIASEFVPQMMDFAKQIADRHCYQLDSGLYFDTTTVADYGALARATSVPGESRIGQVEGKRHPSDFAIWRKTPPGEKRQMEWDSPWGCGVPGWHLECSVMSASLLGLPFDIHTGGIDHREIHHPNEIAQNQAYAASNHSGACLWMHNNFLIDRRGAAATKMSKSEGEFLRLQVLVDAGYSPMAFRLMCLQTHYRNEPEFSWDNLKAALTRLKRLVIAAEPLQGVVTADMLDPRLRQAADAFDAAICEDLNTPVALTHLEYGLFLSDAPEGQRRHFVEGLDAVLGLNLATLKRTDLRLRPAQASISEAEMHTQLALRREARVALDFVRADALRVSLANAHVSVMDGDSLEWDWALA